MNPATAEASNRAKDLRLGKFLIGSVLAAMILPFAAMALSLAILPRTAMGGVAALGFFLFFLPVTGFLCLCGVVQEAGLEGTGPASFVAMGPDGNPVLVDQHV